MRLVVVSDTHSKHRDVKVPDGDVFICSGDITYRGEPHILEDFCMWVKDLPHKNKIVIFGNHEVGMSSGPKRLGAIEMVTDSGAYYLENSSIVLDGVKFYGSPATPRFFDWEWNYSRGKDIAIEWAKIPLDVNVLITHGPPYGILDLVQDTPSNKGRDLHQGCEDLWKRISHLNQLKAHVFGHLHTCGGQKQTVAGVQYGNASISTESYNPINPPVVIDI